jgi:hypothetical protein
MQYVNRWSLSAVWVAAMVVAWFALVPGALSVSSWALAVIGGPILLVGAATFWESSRPTPSFGQSRAAADSPQEAAPRRQP